MNNSNGAFSNGVLVGLLCLLIVFETTGKVLTLKTLGLAILATVVILAAGFGIYSLVDWIKEKKK